MQPVHELGGAYILEQQQQHAAAEAPTTCCPIRRVAVQPDSCMPACRSRGITSPLCASHSMPDAATGPSPTLWTLMLQLCGLQMPGRVHGRGSLRGTGQAVLWDAFWRWGVQTHDRFCSCAGCPCHAV